MQRKPFFGPLHNHSTSTVELTESVCVRSGVEQLETKFRSAHNASSLYSYFKHVHPEIYDVIQLIVENRGKNKRLKKYIYIVTEAFARSTQRKADDALLCLYANPDTSKNVLNNPRFRLFVS